MLNSQLIERLNHWLRILYCAVLLIFPIIAIYYVSTQMAEELTANEIRFLQGGYFIVAIFDLLFIVLYSMYLPTKLTDTTSLLLAPLFGCVVQFLIARQQIGLYLAELGMIYTIEICLAFIILWLGLVGAAIWNAITERSISTLFNGLLLTGMQLLFVIPCAGVIYIFSRLIITVILPQTITGEMLWSSMGIVLFLSFLLPLLQNCFVYLKCLLQESVGW